MSVFKPLKTFWKRGVLEWRQKNHGQALTMDKFAVVLKTVLDSYIRCDIIQNGFRTCGIYPWNPDQLDYTKCLGKIHNKQTNPENNAVLSYVKFKEIIGQEIINSFMNIENMSRESLSPEFLVLFKLWKEYLKVPDKELGLDNINVDSGGADLHTESANETLDLENIPIVFCHDDNLDHLSVLSTNEISTITNEDVASTSNNKTIGDYILWPQTPERKGKRNVTRMPFVLTSSKWKDMQTEKQEKKEEVEQKKQERKRKREQQKELNKSKKAQNVTQVN